MRGLAIVACAAIGGGAFACTQTNVIAYEPPEAGSDAPVETSLDGVPCPSQHFGNRSRAALGDKPGDVMANLKFQGYQNGDTSKGLQEIRLCDYFDPTAKRCKVLHLSAGALWCGPCNAEAEAIVAYVKEQRPNGVVFIQAIDEGVNHGTPSTPSDLDHWVVNHKSNYTTVLDPGPQQLKGFFDPAAVPWGTDIDCRTMEMLTSTLGFSGSIADDVQPAIDWVNGHPPSY